MLYPGFLKVLSSKTERQDSNESRVNFSYFKAFELTCFRSCLEPMFSLRRNGHVIMNNKVREEVKENSPAPLLRWI